MSRTLCTAANLGRKLAGTWPSKMVNAGYRTAKADVFLLDFTSCQESQGQLLEHFALSYVEGRVDTVGAGTRMDALPGE